MALSASFGFTGFHHGKSVAGVTAAATALAVIEVEKIERIFEAENLLDFLKANVKDPLKFHHEFKVTMADCPNACSRPQIADIGIIGAVLPEITPIPCTQCNACIDQCKEEAVAIMKETENPIIDFKSCVMCGQCVTACPSGTIAVDKKGFRIQVGGKLGRHPQLATELPGIFSEDEIMYAVKKCIAYYKKYSQNGQRFGSILNQFEIAEIVTNK